MMDRRLEHQLQARPAQGSGPRREQNERSTREDHAAKRAVEEGARSAPRNHLRREGVTGWAARDEILSQRRLERRLAIAAAIERRREKRTLESSSDALGFQNLLTIDQFSASPPTAWSRRTKETTRSTRRSIPRLRVTRPGAPLFLMWPPMAATA